MRSVREWEEEEGGEMECSRKKRERQKNKESENGCLVLHFCTC